jgi:DNA-binding transcriptional LysR family regulator
VRRQSGAVAHPGAPSWTLNKGAASGTLVLRFVGPTATHEIPGFLAALDKLMPQRDAHVIFDLRELVGHNLDTRAPIQRWLLDNRPRLAQVTVVVNKAATIIKMASSVVGMATGIKLVVRDDLETDGSVMNLR